MSDTLKKWKKTMIEKYGSEEALKEHLRKIAAIGGTKARGEVGFAIQSVEKRREAGRKGGMASRRKK